MSGLRDDFYYRIGRDYYEHMNNSFIYRYVRRERERNLRLRMKEELFCLADTPLSKGRYTRFLVGALLTDKNLAAGLDRIVTISDFLDSAAFIADHSIEEDSIRERLAGLAEYLDRHPVLDIDVDMLREISNELMESFEFEGEKKNPYVQVTSLYMDMDYGLMDNADYIRRLLDFFANNSKYIPGKSDMAVLQEKAFSVWGKDVFNGVRKSTDKIARLIQLAITDESSFVRFADYLMEKNYVAEMTERIQEEILRVEINTLLYDAGFSSDNGTYRSPRKKEKSMEILDAYFKYVGSDPFGRHGETAIPGDYLTWDEYYETCDELKDMLNSNRNDRKHMDMFMPMWLDREVGGGVFLIGRNQFEESAGVQIDSNCELGVVYFLGVEDGRVFEIAAFQTSSYDRDAFPGMEEAVSWFQNYDYREDALEEYRSCNRDAPVGCPDVFLKFFENTAAEDTYEELVSDDDIAETMAEFDMEAQEDRKRYALRSAMKKSHRIL